MVHEIVRNNYLIKDNQVLSVEYKNQGDNTQLSFVVGTKNNLKLSINSYKII